MPARSQRPGVQWNKHHGEKIFCINIKLWNLRWRENETLQSISKSAEQTQKSKKIASLRVTAHILFSEASYEQNGANWGEPFEFFQPGFPVSPNLRSGINFFYFFVSLAREGKKITACLMNVSGLPRTQTSLFWWKCARKGRREGDNGPLSVPFPWSLAVHHQSLRAFRARLCHAKNEAPEEALTAS